MKRYVSIVLVLVLVLSSCLCLSSCKKDDTDIQSPKAENITPLTEQDIRILMEKNLDCYFLFYVAPLNKTTQRNSDGYYNTDGSYFKTYDELEDLVLATYTKEKATELLEYPTADAPLYKDVDNQIYVNPGAITPVEYDIIWDDTYTIDMKKISDTEYALTFTAYDFELNEYVTDSSIVCENGKWRFVDVIY